MTARTSLRLLGTAGLLLGAAAVLVLGGTLVRQVAAAGHSRLGLFAWAAASAVALPVLLTLAAVAASLLARRPRAAAVPNAGWKIPGAGQ